MKICITLDDVLRAKTVQIGNVYKKYVDRDIVLDDIEFDTNDYKEIFNFEDTDSWNKFLYEDYPYEIFGEAGICEKGLNLKLNKWLLDLSEDEDNEDVEVMIGNPYEFNASIGFTCFFLSRTATRAREFFFPEDSSELWDACDVMVTADPKLLAEKPEGKTSVKISMPYNEGNDADMAYDGLGELLDDEGFLEKLKNNKADISNME